MRKLAIGGQPQSIKPRSHISGILHQLCFAFGQVGLPRLYLTLLEGKRINISPPRQIIRVDGDLVSRGPQCVHLGDGPFPFGNKCDPFRHHFNQVFAVELQRHGIMRDRGKLRL